MHLVSVAEGTSSDIHDIPNLDVFFHSTISEQVVQLDLPRLSLLVLGVHAAVLSQPGGVLLLPLPPDAVDHGVVQEEERF